MSPGKSNPLKKVEPTLQHEGFPYTFGLIYLVINILYFFIGASPEWKKNDEVSLFKRIVRSAARGSGSVLNINSALVILVASKIFMSVLRRTPLNMVVPFDKAMPLFHAIIGSTIALASVVHTLSHLINYSTTALEQASGIHGFISLAVTGALCFVCIGVIRLTSTSTVRRAVSYEVWYLCHIIGMVLYMSMLIIHGSHHGKFSSYKFVTGPLAIYLIDIFLRRLRSRKKVVLVPGHSAKTVGPRILKLQMKKEPNFQYLAGQYCYINCPQISFYQWHPFSIASSPHEQHLTFYIKVEGDWTSELYALCSIDSHTQPYPRNLHVYIRGPFGAPAQHVGQYEHVILISGGVGATPFTSITKYAHNYIMNHQVSAHRHAAKSPFAAFQFNYGVHTATAAQRRTRRTGFTRRGRDAFEEIENEAVDIRQEGLDQPPWASEFDPTRTRHAMDATFLSRAKDAANSTFHAFGRTLKNAFLANDFNDSLGDPHAPIPSRGVQSVSDFSAVHDDEYFDMDYGRVGKIYEDEILRDMHETPSMALSAIGQDLSAAPYPYRDVGLDDGAEWDDFFDNPVGWKDRVLVVLHSVTLNWVLLWMMILRFGVVGIGRVTGEFALNQRGLSVYGNMGLNIIDLILSIVLFVPVAFTLMSEIASYGLCGFFDREVGNVFDFVLLTPLALLCVLLHALGLAKIGENSKHVSKVIVFGIWPVLSAFLLWRIIRTIGSRVSLAQYFMPRMAHTKSLDFLWVNRTHADDNWLLEELLPIAASGPVRIHRFLTMKDGHKVDEEWKRKFINEPLKTTYERPDWNKVFLNVVEKSKSGTVIGVFFCGPHKMQRVVQEAAMNAMQQSIRNAFDRGYVPDGQRQRKAARKAAARGDRETGEDGRSEESKLDKAAYGCYVRISVRTENFS